MSEMDTTIATTTSTWVIMVIEMRRFDASDEHNKELRNDLAGIRQKVDTHAILIKQLELQLAQLFATMKHTTGHSS